MHAPSTKAVQRTSVIPAPQLPLPTLLSQVLVAFTIEFDNEFERQMPHRTTAFKSETGSTHTPWLVSLAMWANIMQFVGKEKITARELYRRARITKEGLRISLSGLQGGDISAWELVRCAAKVGRPAPTG